MNPNAYTKTQALLEIAGLVGVPVEDITSRGGTGRAVAIARLAELMGVALTAETKHAMARELVESAGLVWQEEWESSGSTIEARGWAQLLLSARTAGAARAVRARLPHVGRPYQPAPRGAGHGAGVHEVDLDALDRGTKTHGELQDRIARCVSELGITPLSPSVGEPQYDIAWEVADRIVVCEVKSATPSSARQQARIGLGQVLEYRAALRALHEREVHAVLALEVPVDHLARAACASAGVIPIGGAEIEGSLRAAVGDPSGMQGAVTTAPVSPAPSRVIR